PAARAEAVCVEERQVGPSDHIHDGGRTRILGGPRLQQHRGSLDRGPLFVLEYTGKVHKPTLLCHVTPVATLAADEDRADGRKMSFFEHLEELRNRLKIVIIAFIAVFVIMLTFTIEPVMVSSTTLWLPVPTFDQGNTIPAQVIVLLNHSLVRGSAELIIVTPWEAVIVQLKVAMFMAVIFTSPLITYEFWRFVAPALKPSERRLLFRISAPVVVLFLAGVMMSLLVVLPFTFPFLYGFAFPIGARPFLDLEEFL